MIARADRLAWPALVMTAAALLLGGCGSVSDEAQDSSLRALEQPVPPPAKLAAPAPPDRCRGEFDSLPASRLPRPGRMPAGSLMERIHQRGTLRVGVDQNTLRLGYFDPATRTMKGLDIDLVRAVARAIFGRSKEPIENHIVFTAISTAQRESAIEDEAVDLVASAFSINCERKDKMYFSSVYHVAQQKLLVPEDSTVDSVADLRGKRVCATKTSTSIDNLYKTGVVRHPVKLRPDCLVELQEGRVAAITADDAILVGFNEQDPQTKVVGDCINIERYGMAINLAHSEFVRFVNGVLKRLGTDGLERIRRRWLGDLSAPTGAEIARCNRAPERLRAAHAAEHRRQERRVIAGHAAWRRALSAPAIAQLYRCGHDCAYGASP